MPDSLQSLSAADVRQRLSATRVPDDPLAIDTSYIEQRLPSAWRNTMRGKLRPAGVLIPIIERRDALMVLLTERSAELRQHAGQVSFPGGGMEEQDLDVVATALREAEEEVGIRRHEVEIAGYLQPAPTVTGYAVTSVIGLVNPTFELRLDPLEVENAFEVPLDFLLDPRNEMHSEREVDGWTVPVIAFHYGGQRIWGATASILVRLREALIQYS